VTFPAYAPWTASASRRVGAIVWILAAGTLWLGYRSFRRERLLLST
jgi:hypothetical protein